MDWNINIEEVQKVLQATQDAASPFEYTAQMFVGGVNCIMRASGSNFVNQALNDFATHYQNHLPDMAEQIVATINGTVDATKAYAQAQYDMALAAQRRIPDAPAQRRQAEAKQRSYENSKAGDLGRPMPN